MSTGQRISPNNHNLSEIGGVKGQKLRRRYARYPPASLGGILHNAPVFLVSSSVRKAVTALNVTNREEDLRSRGAGADGGDGGDDDDDADRDALEPVVGFDDIAATTTGPDVRMESAMMAFQMEPPRRRGLENDLLTRSVCFGDVFHLRHAITGGYLAMGATASRGAALERRAARLATEDDVAENDDLLAAFKLLPGGPEPRPPLGSPVKLGSVCMLASATRPLRLVADSDARVAFAELPVVSGAGRDLAFDVT